MNCFLGIDLEYQINLSNPNRSWLSIDLFIISITPAANNVFLHYGNVPGLLKIINPTQTSYLINFRLFDKLSQLRQEFSYSINCFAKVDLALEMLTSPGYEYPKYSNLSTSTNNIKGLFIAESYKTIEIRVNKLN